MGAAKFQYVNPDQDRTSGRLEAVSKSYTAVVICQNSLVGLGLKNLLSDSCFEVSEVATYDNALSLIAAYPTINLFVVDGCGNQSNAFGAISSIRSHHPEAKVAIVGDQFTFDDVKAGIALGVAGFCSTSNSEALIKSLELVMLQELVVPFSAVRPVMEGDSLNSEIGPQEDAAEPKVCDPIMRKLSSRETEILRCLIRGASNKVIARQLDVTEATVKVHIKAILRKLRAANRTQAAMWAVEHLVKGEGASLRA